MPNREGDGCSGGLSWAWQKIVGIPSPWRGCCDQHDAAYRRGGPPEARLEADRKLRACVVRQARAAGYPASVALSVAWSMYYGVRAGGWRNAPPLHLLAWPAVKLGWASEFPDYRWSRVPR